MNGPRWLNQLKMCLNALKSIEMHITQKGPKNGKKWQKFANNCKISEITKYGEKMKQIYRNVKKCPKWAKKRGKNG